MSDKLSIAELCTVVKHDDGGKRIRAYLRTQFTRSLESKNARWGDARDSYRLNKTQTTAIIERFAPKQSEAESA